MRFSLAIKKHKPTTIGHIHGHNKRTHPTASQLPQAAWISPEGAIEVSPWRQDVLDRAKALVKRKDAVPVIELVIQVGDQAAWRLPPTPAAPYGAPRPGVRKTIAKIAKAAQAAAEAEFGADNIIAIDLHLDETSPHIHIVAAPIHEGRLQAKHWLDGSRTVAALRERIHAHINAAVPCSYTKGSDDGGRPHDKKKRAGSAATQEKTLMDAALALVSGAQKAHELAERVRVLEDQLAAAFAREKRAALELARQQEQSKNERAALERRIEEAEARVSRVNREWTERAENWARRESELKDLYADADSSLRAYQQHAQAARTPH